MSETEYLVGKNCGVTFAGIKPASLVSVKRGYEEKTIGIAEKFSERGFFCVCLRCLRDRCVMLIYNENALKEILFSAENRAFLKEYGYEYKSVTEALETLARRMRKSDFPHEVGVFLGYPLADVKGFIHSPKEGLKLCGYWKVYGDVQSAAKKFDRYKRCSECICRRMESGESLAKIFKVG